MMVFEQPFKNRDMKGLGLFDMFDKIEFCGHYWDEREGPLDLKELSVSLIYFINLIYICYTLLIY